ncbi:BTAD domain-containing putative transcriptional regulator [Micromonospora sp. DT4]|uniref:AfsR/SARP family transcriptional regulator n=1 Tax=Micromonospora sp. DT4 TaxID=3393438 RepID=UPI003CEA8391
MRWPRQMMSLLFVLTLLAGPPIVLLSLVGAPIQGWPTAAQAQEWVQNPLTEQSLTAALTIAAWLVWLLLAYTVTIRMLTRLSTTVSWLRRMPLPTPWQATAGGIAGAAVFGVSSHAITAPPPPPTQPVAAGTFGDADNPRSSDRDLLANAGINVTGGWLPRDVAEQVSAAAALVWLRRRRSYRPHPPGPPSREDTDLAPLPPTVAAVQAALADSTPPPTEPVATSTGSSPLNRPTVGEAFARAGVGLTGLGAQDAARGLLVTSLLAGRHHPAVSVVVTRAVLAGLLGPIAESLERRLPGLAVIDHLTQAAEFFSGKHPGHGLAGRNQAHRNTQERTNSPGPTLIVDAASATDNAETLASLATASAAVAVLARWPAGQTWQVDPSGRTHHLDGSGSAGPRMCVLTQVTATDLLTVIAHPDPALPEPGASSPSRNPALAGRSPQWKAAQDHPVRFGNDKRRLQLRVLGEPTLLLDGHPVEVRRTAALQVLVFLAAHPDGADTRQLTDAIWPGLPRRSLTGRLYTTLSDLRATIRSRAGATLIEHSDDRYRLDPTAVTVDLWHFHHAVRDATTAVATDATTWKAVIDAYPGDLAARRTWPWLDPIREATRRHVIDAHAALASASPDARQALAWLQAGIRIDPYNADLHTQAVSALITLGDHDAADHLREDYTRRLAAAGILPTDTAFTTATLTGQPAIRTR